MRQVTCAFCGEIFFTKDARKLYCNKQHADRARNAHYETPATVQYETVKDLKHYSKLSPAGRRKILLAKGKFSVAMWDIEATHLKANVGRILCASIKPFGLPAYTLDALAYRKNDVYDDSDLALAIKDELEKYDIIVGWNSRMFDTKYINARLIRAGLPLKEPQYHIDGMWQWATKTAAWKGLKSVQSYLEVEERKTEISWAAWMRALGWSKRLRDEAMAEIDEHCEKDVIVLEEVYRKLVNADMVRTLKLDGGML